jgi:hypothetical protein
MRGIKNIPSPKKMIIKKKKKHNPKLKNKPKFKKTKIERLF